MTGRLLDTELKVFATYLREVVEVARWRVVCERAAERVMS